MSRILCIDPGASPGWAIFDNKRLREAGTYDPDHGSSLPALNERAFGGENSREVVVEIPRIYPHGGKGDQNDIIELALAAGIVLGHFWHLGVVITRVHPRRWKGTVPKEIHHARVIDELEPYERLVLGEPKKKTKANPHGFDNNMLDAIGLGLWRMERMGP